jgi:hypothetical protein
MKQYPFFCAVILAVPLAGQELAKADRIADGGGAARPPVLRTAEPTDSMIVTLPAPPAPPRETNAPPASLPPAGNDDPNDHRPLLRRAPKPILPSEFERDSALFTQKMIGLWSEPDAYNLFGEPLRERVVLDDQEVENGRIYAFTDPTGRYREVELDFAKDTGVLRTVFVYPWKMTWEDCRKQWGGNVRSTEANKGRIFHSYLNRRVDVLVDQRGLVISLGLY